MKLTSLAITMGISLSGAMLSTGALAQETYGFEEARMVRQQMQSKAHQMQVDKKTMQVASRSAKGLGVTKPDGMNKWEGGGIYDTLEKIGYDNVVNP